MSKPPVPDWPSLYDPFIDLFDIPHRDAIQPGGHYLYDASDIFRFTLYWTLIFYLPIFVLSGILASANIAFPPKPRHNSLSSSSPEKRYAEESVLSRDGQHEEEEEETYPLAPLNKPSSAAASPTSPAFPSTAPASSSPSSPSPSGIAFGAKHTGVSISSPDPVPSAGSLPARVSTSTSTTPALAQHPPKAKAQAQINPHRTRIVYSLLVLLAYLVAGFLGAVLGSVIVGYVLAGLYKSGDFYMSTWIPPLFALVQALIGVLGIYPSIAEII